MLLQDSQEKSLKFSKIDAVSTSQLKGIVTQYPNATRAEHFLHIREFFLIKYNIKTYNIEADFLNSASAENMW